jgi:hypothetical protein
MMDNNTVTVTRAELQTLRFTAGIAFIGGLATLVMMVFGGRKR